VNDPIVVRVAFLAPVAKGAVVELTYFGKGGLFGDVVYDEEPALVDRSTGVVYLSDRFLLPDRTAPMVEQIPSAHGLRAVRTIAGTVQRSVVVSPVISNAPLSTELTLVPSAVGSPYRKDAR
jgi:hypothetical protein